VPVLQILLIAMVSECLERQRVRPLLSLESQGWLLKTGAIAVVLSIALDLLLIPRWGALERHLQRRHTSRLGDRGIRSSPAAPAARGSNSGGARGGNSASTLAPGERRGAVPSIAPLLLLSGAVGCTVYVIALDRLGVVSMRLLLGRIRPSSTPVEEVSS